jgi:SOS-response transcriptional repressor LexA
MTDTRPLTPRQQAILAFVEGWYVGRPLGPGPSIAEISRTVGCSRDQGAQRDIGILIGRGLLEREDGLARSLRPTFRTSSHH